MADNKSAASLWFSIVSLFHFISMAFLIICCLTAPVFKQIGLSKYNDYTYGVFGYCDSINDSCSKAAAVYDPTTITESSDNWRVRSTIRHNIRNILIVTPIAAGLNFFTFIIATVFLTLILINDRRTNFLMLLGHLFFSFISFAATALGCIITFLLFFPNMTWCSWLLIPAAALPLIAMPLTFLAHSYSRVPSYDNNSDDADSYDAELIRVMDKEDDFQLNNKSNGNFVLPDFNQTEKMTHSNSTLLDNSTASLSTKDLNNITEKQITNNEQDEENDVLDSNDPNFAYSAINSDRLASNHGSIKSKGSKFKIANTGKDENNPINKMYTLSTSSEGSFNINDRQIDAESDSGLTSVSQRGVNPHYVQYQQQQQRQQLHQRQQGLQYHNNNQINNMNMQPFNQPQVPQQRPMNNQMPRNLQYNQPNPQNQRYQMQSHYTPPLYQQQKQYNVPINNAPPPPGAQFSSNRYKPAYKSQMGRNNIPGASSMTSPYGFR
ncbi:hypothetical protein TPHA_0A02520 [Tetrapisispora phaffii CBS 4417]|uniref:PH-response regulator protein palI/RIM9 n=1 Tax=Tetrapisispora phaffii (strain ATCC 24235 / CBS 4417 / NBRC 1672 / NRRL Y-8282 / UCD 70-5) TaxID=1071381 RepID=G8BN57_TETPH|nr:hypothetical protein TPHA_0A02520 [Tetrapisispora phaffii CBS 4417]CCE61335.1 hypothetical protein TPHA_0A02520 [Tetrapisispora phaffii CBS 4417]